MSVFKGTPGPWMAVGDGCVRHDIPCGKDVFNQSIKLGSGWIESAWTDGDADEETLANARLIAAAPDLLEALENLLEKHTTVARCFDCRKVAAARAAIARATGEA